VLSDVDRAALRAYGIVHEGGGLEGETIAVPASCSCAPTARSPGATSRRAITDRADPDDVLVAIGTL
jgi:hypothetical protein